MLEQEKDSSHQNDSTVEHSWTDSLEREQYPLPKTTSHSIPFKRGFWLKAFFFAFAFAGTSALVFFRGTDRVNPTTQSTPIGQENQSEVNYLPVETLELQPVNSYQVSRSYTGTIEASQSSQLGFEQRGKLIQVYFGAGDRVLKGDAIARLTTDALRVRQQQLNAQLQQEQAVLDELESGSTKEAIAAAQAVVRNQEAQLQLSQQRYERRLNLYEEGAISREELDSAVSETDARRASLDEAQSQLDERLAGTRNEQLAAQRALVAERKASLAALNLDLERSVLTAPFSGIIAQRFVDEGTVVEIGQPIVQILDNQTLKARVGVPTEVAASLEIGTTQQIQIEDNYYTAQVKAILPELDTSTRTQPVELTLDPDAATPLATGQIVRIHVQETISVNGYWLPTTALERGVRGLWSCYVLGETADETDSDLFQVERREVEILHTDGQRVLVRGTLDSGERLIISGIHRLAPGQIVQRFQS